MKLAIDFCSFLYRIRAVLLLPFILSQATATSMYVRSHAGLKRQRQSSPVFPGGGHVSGMPPVTPHSQGYGGSSSNFSHPPLAYNDYRGHPSAASISYDSTYASAPVNQLGGFPGISPAMTTDMMLNPFSYGGYAMAAPTLYAPATFVSPVFAPAVVHHQPVWVCSSFCFRFIPTLINRNPNLSLRHQLIQTKIHI